MIFGTGQDWTIGKGSICWSVRKVEDDTETTFIKAVLRLRLIGKNALFGAEEAVAGIAQARHDISTLVQM